MVSLFLTCLFIYIFVWKTRKNSIFFLFMIGLAINGLSFSNITPNSFEFLRKNNFSTFENFHTLQHHERITFAACVCIISGDNKSGANPKSDGGLKSKTDFEGFRKIKIIISTSNSSANTTSNGRCMEAIKLKSLIFLSFHVCFFADSILNCCSSIFYLIWHRLENKSSRSNMFREINWLLKIKWLFGLALAEHNLTTHNWYWFEGAGVGMTARCREFFVRLRIWPICVNNEIV